MKCKVFAKGLSLGKKLFKKKEGGLLGSPFVRLSIFVSSGFLQIPPEAQRAIFSSSLVPSLSMHDRHRDQT